LVEPPGQGDIIYNDNLKANSETVFENLCSLIGDYNLYKTEN